MVKRRRSANHVLRNIQEFLVTDKQRGQNTDDKVCEQHADPQENLVAITRGRRSKRIANNNQREKSMFNADQQVGGNTNESAIGQHDDPQDEVFEQYNDNRVGRKTNESAIEQHDDPQAEVFEQRNDKWVGGKSNESAIEQHDDPQNEVFEQRNDQRVGGDTNESAIEQHNDPQDKVFEQRKARGYTYMPHLWAISSNHSNMQPLKIEFNKYGKPIGPNKSNYVEFLGSIARNGNLAPLHYKDWHKVPSNFKKDMLDKVKGSFVVPNEYDKIVLQALSKSWRAFKCRIKAKYFNPKSTMEQNLHRRPDELDERVKEDQWKFLVEYWCSEESKKASNKNKETRAMKKIHHNTGKRSFAQVYEMTKEEALHNVGIEENDMDDDENVEDSEISEQARVDIFSKCYSRNENTSNPEVANALLKRQLPPGARDEYPNDVYSPVLGEEITAKEVYDGHSLGRDDIHRIAMEKERLEKELEEKDELIQKLLRNEELRKELEEKNKLIERLLRKEDLRGHSNITNVSFPSTSSNSGRSQSARPSNVNSRPLQVGAKVLLKGIIAPGNVAQAIVESLNPTKILGNGELLGHEWCELKVTVAIEYEEPLIWKVGGVKVVGQAIGRSIVWPKHLVQVEDAR